MAAPLVSVSAAWVDVSVAATRRSTVIATTSHSAVRRQRRSRNGPAATRSVTSWAVPTTSTLTSLAISSAVRAASAVVVAEHPEPAGDEQQHQQAQRDHGDEGHQVHVDDRARPGPRRLQQLREVFL
jgi:hypothetical protein